MPFSVEKFKKFLKFWKLYTAILSPFVPAFLFFFSTNKATRCAYVILIMIINWLTEALPIPVTALIPVFAFPLLGIMSSSVICKAYVSENLLLFLGGLIVAIAIECSNLHKRIALFIILHIGQSSRKLLLSFMLTTMILSMWISNTATTTMMIPIVDAVLKELCKAGEKKDLELLKIADGTGEEDAETEKVLSPKYALEITLPNYGEDGEGACNPEELNILYMGATEETVREIPDENKKTNKSVDIKTLKNMYFLGVIYSANIGGTGTLTGSGTNLIVKGNIEESFDLPTGLNYGTWMAFNVPGVILCTLGGFIWLQYFFIGFGSKSPKSSKENEEKVKKYVHGEYKSLGRISFHESSVLTILVILVLLWLLRNPGFIPGWMHFIKMYYPNIVIGDSVAAILAAVFLFIIPCEPNFWPSYKYKDESLRSCVTWRDVHEKLPWNVLLLLGGGYAIAKGCNESGLSVFIGERLRFFDSLSPSLCVLIISISTALVTDIASNSATSSVILPILREMALKMCINPLYLMLPAGVCCSYAFMLPIGTPPNAIVYGAAGGDIKISTMIKAGIVMNIICVLIINIMINTLGVAMFNVWELPDWVNSTSTQVYFQDCLKNSTVISP